MNLVPVEVPLFHMLPQEPGRGPGDTADDDCDAEDVDPVSDEANPMTDDSLDVEGLCDWFVHFSSPCRCGLDGLSGTLCYSR
jgi:hypothetical protein